MEKKRVAESEPEPELKKPLKRARRGRRVTREFWIFPWSKEVKVACKPMSREDRVRNHPGSSFAEEDAQYWDKFWAKNGLFMTLEKFAKTASLYEATKVPDDISLFELTGLHWPEFEHGGKNYRARPVIVGRRFLGADRHTAMSDLLDEGIFGDCAMFWRIDIPESPWSKEIDMTADQAEELLQKLATYRAALDQKGK